MVHTACSIRYAFICEYSFIESPMAVIFDGSFVFSLLVSRSSWFVLSYLQNGDFSVKKEATPIAPLMDYLKDNGKADVRNQCSSTITGIDSDQFRRICQHC